jgi:2-polyprenyl-3-methyl-5-hydroxy-6-metoxy-1,4-benzoquinol methylase
MDQLGLDAQLHAQALRALARINVLSHSAGILWPPIRALARRRPQQPISILDLASGGGDVTIGLWHRLRRAGIPARLVGHDKSPTAVEIARQRARQAGADVDFVLGDALDQAGGESFDVTVSSLFMHHLDRGEALLLLRRMKKTARRLVLVNDLLRSRLGYALALAVTRVVTRSSVARVDGPRSVQGAFTVAEVERLAAEAGLSGAAVDCRWPCRFLLSWNAPSDACAQEGEPCGSVM